jgi:Flp pilus assembly protein TadD
LVILLAIVMAMVFGGAFVLRGPRPAIEPGQSVFRPAPPGSPSEELQAAVVDRGIARARAGALVEAEADFRRALAREPDRVDVWNNLGVVLVRAGDLEAGLAAFREALGLAPDDAETHRNLAVVLDRRGRPAEAARHYRAFLAVAPADHPDRAEVGRRLAARGPRRGKP